MYEPSMEPQVERFIHSLCAQCKGDIILSDELGECETDLHYAWFDSEGNLPFCCKECKKDYVHCFGCEYEEERNNAVDDFFEKQLLKAAKIFSHMEERK